MNRVHDHVTAMLAVSDLIIEDPDLALHPGKLMPGIGHRLLQLLLLTCNIADALAVLLKCRFLQGRTKGLCRT